MWTGGCFCGEIRYEASGPATHQSVCHCSVCRRTAGAPCLAWFTVEQAAFRYTRGAPSNFQSSADAVRSFCPRCGTQLTFVDRRYAGQVDLTTASLDDPELAPPQKHIYTSTQLSWLKLSDGLPRYAESSEGAQPL